MSSQPWSLPLRADLAGIDPYGAPQLDVPIRLNVNENPFAPSEAVVQAIASEVERTGPSLNRYPDREAHRLRTMLGSYLEEDAGVTGLTCDRIWAANGSNEVMLQLFQAFGGPDHTALSFSPTYAMYPEYARDSLTPWVALPRSDDFTVSIEMLADAVDSHSPTLVVLASPNNPTGTALPIETIVWLCDNSNALVIIDEAYGEFRREDTLSALTMLDAHPNLVVTRTMSKAFAFAGGRLGYLAASPEIVDALRIVRLPYHLSAVTQAAAIAALSCKDELLQQVALLRTERDALQTWLRDRGLDVAQSDANFVFFGRFEDRHAIWKGLLDRGILIREVGPEQWLRVSIGAPTEMAAFRAALTEVADL